MSGQVLRDSMGRKLGEITTDTHGRQTLRDEMGRKLGEYDPNTDVTRDAMGHKVGNGNLLMTLL